MLKGYCNTPAGVQVKVTSKYGTIEFNVTKTGEDDFFLEGAKGIELFHKEPNPTYDAWGEKVLDLTLHIKLRVNPPYDACCVARAALGIAYRPFETESAQFRQTFNFLDMTCFGESALPTCDPTIHKDLPTAIDLDCHMGADYDIMQYHGPSDDYIPQQYPSSLLLPFECLSCDILSALRISLRDNRSLVASSALNRIISKMRSFGKVSFAGILALVTCVRTSVIGSQPTLAKRATNECILNVNNNQIIFVFDFTLNANGLGIASVDKVMPQEPDKGASYGLANEVIPVGFLQYNTAQRQSIELTAFKDGTQYYARIELGFKDANKFLFYYMANYQINFQVQTKTVQGMSCNINGVQWDIWQPKNFLGTG
ncbi:hypothetical protein E5Q_03019 [Mixia osmundae IAM 14324]|uniref:Uncharacterized protein n=1 Tax=Mixia osmundae (strain CBS 9802 / IAM 14324 / JCM 22182 / KY 12970) TaxID=764103 RepID=G7E0J3_MIXOS|nr:hypothetical protein E5Q_03019 [Mixia osmundae IAM 14324]